MLQLSDMILNSTGKRLCVPMKLEHLPQNLTKLGWVGHKTSR